MNILESYIIESNGKQIKVEIRSDPQEFVTIYNCELLDLSGGTKLLLETVRKKLIDLVEVGIEEIVDAKAFDQLKQRYVKAAENILLQEFPKIPVREKNELLEYLINKMLGLGNLELLLQDDKLEEIVVNSADEFVWAYHKKYGWLKTNLKIDSESQVHNYASLIGRRVGREITNLRPLMDARLSTGDRVNATLMPISTKGNTLTIRKFARTPWSVIDFIDPKVRSISPEIAALLWLGIQNELNILVAGGTGSGKTSMLNALTPFIPANQRVISIEDTRELQLPNFLHWVPMVTRSPNPEGKGEVTMLDLMINSLRMRPDRIIVGEIRRGKEAEVLFEAMHTGHAVYSTVHADNVAQTYRRLVNPPINIPEEMLESLHLILVQFRQRRLNIRRTFQVAEVELPEEYAQEVQIKFNLLYKWIAKTDTIEQVNPSNRVISELEMRAGMNIAEIEKDLEEKTKILNWMLKNNIHDVNRVGEIVSHYYADESKILDLVKKNALPKFI